MASHYVAGWVIQAGEATAITDIGEYANGGEATAALQAFNKCAELLGFKASAHIGYDTASARESAQKSLNRELEAATKELRHPKEMPAIVQTQFE